MGFCAWLAPVSEDVASLARAPASGPRRRAGTFLAESSPFPPAELNTMKVVHEAPNTPRVPRRGPYPKTGAPVPGFEAQARQAFENLRAILEDAGSGLPHVVKTTCFLAEPEGLDPLNALYAEYFTQTPPARSTPVVKLPRGLLFSIEAIAALPQRA